MSEKAFYYRVDSGERMGPWPSTGKWPGNYAARGFSLTPPALADASEVEGGEDIGDVDLNALSTSELKALAKSRSVPRYSRMTRDELLEAMAEQPAEDEEDESDEDDDSGE